MTRQSSDRVTLPKEESPAAITQDILNRVKPDRVAQIADIVEATDCKISMGYKWLFQAPSGRISGNLPAVCRYELHRDAVTFNSGGYAVWQGGRALEYTPAANALAKYMGLKSRRELERLMANVEVWERQGGLYCLTSPLAYAKNDRIDRRDIAPRWAIAAANLYHLQQQEAGRPA